MKKILNKNIVIILIPIIILITFSILNMINAGLIMENYSNYHLKQTTWFFLGIILMIAISNFKSKFIFKYSYLLYILNVILLILVLLIGTEVNNTKAWFDLKYFSFQPSETMKISLILVLSSIISHSRTNNLKQEFILILKVFLITLIPALLTFMEPDTGAVIIYFIIAIIILFSSKIKLRWFAIALVILIISLIGFIYLYNYHQNIFIDIFGTDFFYRIDRLLEFKDGTGLQLENALIAIGSAGMFGSGIKTVSIYFPEAPTDFVFALSVSNFGLIGGILIIFCYIIIFLILIKHIKKYHKIEHKLFLVGFIGMMLYQVIQNIFMNLGLLPIVGITLPFLSYGGTSTLLYFICIGIILNLFYDKEKYPTRIF